LTRDANIVSGIGRTRDRSWNDEADQRQRKTC
jgi:hypothetical protein